VPHAFRLTFTFVGPYAHGVDGRGDPEWPPSPLRAFQALVAAAARLPAADALGRGRQLSLIRPA
jgi:CRISPR-associated protein Csb2